MSNLDNHSLDFFIWLYRLIPAWFVAAWIGLASLGFYVRFLFIRRTETLWRYPYGSLAAGTGLAVMALNYLLIALGAYSSIEVAAGGVRVFLVLMGVSLTYFTRDGYEAAWLWLRGFSCKRTAVALRASWRGRLVWRGRFTKGEHYDDDGA